MIVKQWVLNKDGGFDVMTSNRGYIDWDVFQWGPLKDDLRATFYREYKDKDPYSEVYEVKENDIVLDIGASNGIYTRSIVNKKPYHVFCLEPTKTLFPYLVANTISYPVTHINKALSNTNYGFKHTGGSYSGPDQYETTTFEAFIETFGIDYIDYIKTDCEGGEYELFTDETIDFLLSYVGCIVGEFHLGNPKLKEQFRVLRDKYLPLFKNVKVCNVLGADITHNLHTEEFIRHYSEIILHISNKS